MLNGLNALLVENQLVDTVLSREFFDLLEGKETKKQPSNHL